MAGVVGAYLPSLVVLRGWQRAELAFNVILAAARGAALVWEALPATRSQRSSRPVAAALRQHGGLAAGIVAILLGTHALAGAGAATVLGVSVVAAHVVVLVRRGALGMAAR
jgi:hypothetical protein